MDIIQMHLNFRLQVDKSGRLEFPAFEPEEIDFWLNAAIHRFVKNRFTGSDKNIGFEEHLKRTEDLKTLVVETSIEPSSGSIKPNSFIANLSTLTDKWFILGEEVLIRYIKLGEVGYTTKRQGITECTVDTYRPHIDDPYSEHILHYEEAKPLRLVYQNTIELVTDGNYTITYYYIRYLKRPKRVNVLTVAYTTSNAYIQEDITYLVSGTAVTYNGVEYAVSQSFVGVSGITGFTGTGTATMVVASCDLPSHTHNEIITLATSMVLENIEQPRYQTQMNELSKIE